MLSPKITNPSVLTITRINNRDTNQIQPDRDTGTQNTSAASQRQTCFRKSTPLVIEFRNFLVGATPELRRVYKLSKCYNITN